MSGCTVDHCPTARDRLNLLSDSTISEFVCPNRQIDFDTTNVYFLQVCSIFFGQTLTLREPVGHILINILIYSLIVYLFGPTF